MSKWLQVSAACGVKYLEGLSFFICEQLNIMYARKIIEILEWKIADFLAFENKKMLIRC